MAVCAEQHEVGQLGRLARGKFRHGFGVVAFDPAPCNQATEVLVILPKKGWTMKLRIRSLPSDCGTLSSPIIQGSTRKGKFGLEAVISAFFMSDSISPT